MGKNQKRISRTGRILVGKMDLAHQGLKSNQLNALIRKWGPLRQYYNYLQENSQDQRLAKAILDSLIFGIPKPRTRPICESTDQEWRHHLVILFAEITESSTVAPFETLMNSCISKIKFTRNPDQMFTCL